MRGTWKALSRYILFDPGTAFFRKFYGTIIISPKWNPSHSIPLQIQLLQDFRAHGSMENACSTYLRKLALACGDL